jgi:hypothetical protein
MKKILISFLFVIVLTAYLYPQSVKYIYPDSGYQGTNFPVTIIGDGTQWMVSTYFNIFFDTTGVVATYTNKINDTTLTAMVYIDGKAIAIPRGIYVLDRFSNVFSKDSALKILLTIPVVPTLLLPANNATNQLQDVSLLWDSNGSANTFRIQISSDSLFTNPSFFYDTVVANTPFHIRPNFLGLGMKYYWRVNATNLIGTSGWSEIWNFRIRTTGINLISSEIPAEFKLLNNYPNPFNPVTKIRFQSPKTSGIEINIFDITGKKITGLLKQTVQAGIYEIVFDASGLPSGIYFVQMLSGGFSAVNKIAFVK